MKKVISVVLSCIIFIAAAGIPAVANTVSYDLTKSAVLKVTAANYTTGYDASKDQYEHVIEGGNISFNINDYVEYALNVEAAGLYYIEVETSLGADTIAVLDFLIDGNNQFRQSYPGTGFGNFTKVKNYLYIDSGAHTLRINNVERGLYLRSFSLKFIGESLNVDSGAVSFKGNGEGIGSSLSKGSCIAFCAESEKGGIYKVDVSARRRSGSFSVYLNDGYDSSISVPSGLAEATSSAYIKLKEGKNIVRLKVYEGSINPTNVVLTKAADISEEILEIAKQAEKLNSADEIHNLLKENENILGFDIDDLTSTLSYPEFVYIRLLNKTYVNALEFVKSILNAVSQETSSPSILATISGENVTVKAKTDIYKSNGVFAVASFEGSRLAAVNYGAYKKGTDVTVTLSGHKSGNSLKFIVLDSMDKINPSDISGGIMKNIYVSESGSDSLGDGTEVNPYKTIKKAKEVTESLVSSMTGDIVINITSGVYELSETETFSEKHGGKDGYKVIYKGTDKENPPVISGGKRVEGWQNEGNGIYSAEYDGEEIRNLYVNDNMALRARSKYAFDEWTYVDDTTMNLSKKGMPESFAHPEDLVFVWTLYWATQYTPVLSSTDKGETFEFKMDDIFKEYVGTSNIRIEEKKRFYMENALEFLDEAGEFYHDYHAGKIYYMPYANENMANAEVFASNLDKMIDISGSSNDEKVKNIVFDNIAFKHGTRNKNSIMQIQADQHFENGVEKKIQSQFVVNYADGISIRNCEFSCIGSNALEFFDGVTNSEIKGNLIKDIGGTGISVGNFTRPRYSDDGAICTNICISDNVIRRTSQVYRGTTAIAVYYERNIDVIKNDIAELPYSGITAGWGWGTAREKFGNINISNNRIHDVIKTLTDGGHIYTLGNMPGSVISENYMTKSGDYRGGIYTDSGSQNISLLRNVCDNSSLWWHVGLYYTKNMTADGNFSPRNFVNNSGENIVIKNHTAVSDGNFEKAASDIINNAGVSDEYKYLLEKAEKPEGVQDHSLVPLDTYQDTQETWIEAEDFDPVSGVGYKALNFDEPYNNIYRPEGLNLYRNMLTNKGYYIHRVAKGDWMAYTVEVPEDGIYFFDLKAANAYDDTYKTIVDISVDGKVILDNVKFPNTGDWYNFTSVRMGKLNLTKGTHKIKIYYAGSGFHIDAFRLKSENISIPMSEHKSAYCTNKKTDSLYIEGGNTTWHLNDWAEYEVEITEPGTYTFGMNFGSSVGAGLKNVVKVNGTEVLSVLKLSKGTYADKKDVDFGSITFDKAGTYTLRVENTGGNGGHYVGDIYLKYAG